MGIFGSIKDAIFGGDDKPAKSDIKVGRAEPAKNFPKTNISYAPGTEPRMDEVDVERRLDAKPEADKLNWRNSIVDLMKLVDIDPSFENRKELANELGDRDYSGKAEENVWLHRQVMQGLAKNGGKVPAQYLD